MKTKIKVFDQVVELDLDKSQMSMFGGGWDDKKVQKPGSRGGKYWINSKGEVIYGDRHAGKIKKVDSTANQFDIYLVPSRNVPETKNLRDAQEKILQREYPEYSSEKYDEFIKKHLADFQKRNKKAYYRAWKATINQLNKQHKKNN